jgi:hypothetical protein
VAKPKTIDPSTARISTASGENEVRSILNTSSRSQLRMNDTISPMAITIALKIQNHVGMSRRCVARLVDGRGGLGHHCLGSGRRGLCRRGWRVHILRRRLLRRFREAGGALLRRLGEPSRFQPRRRHPRSRIAARGVHDLGGAWRDRRLTRGWRHDDDRQQRDQELATSLRLATPSARLRTPRARDRRSSCGRARELAVRGGRSRALRLRQRRRECGFHFASTIT